MKSTNASALMIKSIMLTAINVTKKTAELTGFSTYDEIVANQNKLFKSDKHASLLVKTKKLYNNGKELDKKFIDIIKEMSEGELRQLLIDSLTFQYVLEQKKEVDSASKKMSNIGNLRFRLNVGKDNGSSKVKSFYYTTDFGSLLEDVEAGLTVDCNFSEFALNQGLYDMKEQDRVPKFVFIKQYASVEPEIKDGEIVSLLRTTGAGGNAILKDGLLTFLRKELIVEDTTPEHAPLQYAALAAFEVENVNEYKYNEEDSIPAEDVPSDARDEFGQRSDDYVNWVAEHFAQRNQKVFSAVE